MTLAFNDVKILTDMLDQGKDFSTVKGSAASTAAFMAARKPLSVTMNLLSNLVYNVRIYCPPPPYGAWCILQCAFCIGCPCSESPDFCPYNTIFCASCFGSKLLHQDSDDGSNLIPFVIDAVDEVTHAETVVLYKR